MHMPRGNYSPLALVAMEDGEGSRGQGIRHGTGRAVCKRRGDEGRQAKFRHKNGGLKGEKGKDAASEIV